MRTATLTFLRNRMVITNGIRIVPPAGDGPLCLFASPERSLLLERDPANPPLLLAPLPPNDPETRFLATLSLANGPGGEVRAAKERSPREGVLLLVDTWDSEALRAPGRYELPPGHDARLPHAQHATPQGGADCGLLVCAAGSSFIVRSTGGILVKLRLGPGDHFVAEPSTREERILMEVD